MDAKYDPRISHSAALVMIADQNRQIADLTRQRMLRREMDAERDKNATLEAQVTAMRGAIEEAPHYCTPSDDWRCRTYNGHPECNCWKSRALAAIQPATEPKGEDPVILLK